MLAADLIAGVTVGLVALPLAMAFAIASGLPPQTGLFCGDHRRLHHLRPRRLARADWRPHRRIRGGGLRHRGDYGLDGLFMCTLMAGVMLMLLGSPGWAPR